MSEQRATYLIMCDEPRCTRDATHWQKIEDDDITWTCETHIVAAIIEKLKDDTQESGACL